VFLNDRNRKNWSTIIRESLQFWWVKREFPFFYFGKFLYRTDVKNPTRYLSSKEANKITTSNNFNRYQYTSLLRNKLAFAYHMEHAGIPVAKRIGHNFRKKFYIRGECIRVNNDEELHIYLTRLLINNGLEKLFIKSIVEMGGNGCFMLTKENLEHELSFCSAYILSNDCIHQAPIKQHPDFDNMYKESLNTIRFDTYIDKQGKRHILSGLLRIGCGGHYLDNSTAGGIYLSIDMNSGRLKGKSHQLMQHGGCQMKQHPDSGTVFHNWQIPYFEEAKELTLRALEHIPDRIIGWDIGISEDGPVLVEGNDNNNLVTPDVAYGGYAGHPLFEEIISEA